LALLKIEKTNKSGFPTVAIQSKYSDPEGAGPPQNVIDGVYEGGDVFSIDIGFLAPVPPIGGGEGEPTYEPATITKLVSVESDIAGITFTKVGDIIRISGSATGVFTDSYYQFIMKDKSLKILPVDTEEPYLSIVKWSPPSIKQKLDVPYNIKIKYTSTSILTETEETVTILQDIYWSYPPAVAGFKALLAKGTI
jgi:hypothetical protein